MAQNGKYITSYFVYRDETINEPDYATLKISSFGEMTDTIWFSSGLNCAGNEFCLSSCLPSIPNSPLSQCSNEVGVRCSKCRNELVSYV